MVLTAQRPDDGRGLYKAYAEGPGGRLLLGTLLPEAEGLRLTRILSREELRQHGAWPVLRVEAQLSFSFAGTAAVPPGWDWSDRVGEDLEDRKVGRQLEGLGRVLFRRQGRLLTIAVPYQPEKQFPLTEFFCFAQVRELGGNPFCLFSFDRSGWPVVEKSE